MKAHWERVYRDKGPEGVSWFQREARIALDLIERVAPDPETRILDAGGGTSHLVDGLLDAGYRRITVVDISGEAIRLGKERIGARASLVDWREADVLEVELPASAYGLWHDRAVFHFLTARADRERYLQQVRQALRPGGLLIMATFAEDGPLRCSALDVQRYSASSLAVELGSSFQPLESTREEHRTPSGAVQAFTWLLARLSPDRRTEA